MSETVETQGVSRPSDKWIPWYFVLFFVVLVALDGTFATIAIRTQTGLVTEDYYEEGVHYNDTLSAEAKIENLGWHSEMALADDGTFVLTLKDRDMTPLSGAQVTAKIERPVQDGYDFGLPLVETGNGRYVADIDFPMPGQWRIRIFTTWQNQQYQRSMTFFVPKS